MAHKYILWIALISTSSQAYRGYNDRHMHRITFEEDQTGTPSFQRFYRQYPDDYRYPNIGRPTRANERSIPVNSELQKVQEEEKRRLDSSKTMSPMRNEKIVNSSSRTRLPMLTNRNGQTHENMMMRDGVVFPGPTAKSGSFVPEVPDDCKKTGICEKIPNYPVDYVNNLISTIEVNKYKLNRDELEPEISQRLGPPNEVSLCNVIERASIPEALPNLDDQWKFIVNKRNEDALQIFRIELCTNPGGPCDTTYATFRNHRTKCKQRYVYRSMLALNSTNGDVYSEFFKLPSCCSCVIKTEEFDD